MSARLADQDARDAIRSELGTTLVVEAAAGTGKTTELVQRVLSLLLTGTATLARIVCVTFTDKAAGEMKLRLRKEIERARSQEGLRDVERERLVVALSELEAARIGTIHGFCAEVLREHAIESRVDPEFGVIAEEDQDRIYGEAFDRWFAAQLASPSEGVGRVLRRRARDRDAGTPRRQLFRAGLELIGRRDFFAPWRRDPFDREAALDLVVDELRELGELGAKSPATSDYLAMNLMAVRRWIEELDRTERVRERDYDGLEADLRQLLKDRSWKWSGGRSKWYAPGIEREAVRARRDDVHARALAVLDRCEADLAALLREELRPLVRDYEEQKERAGKLDFDDLLLRTRNLLVASDVVRRELQERFSHLLVDEFQDTDPLQAEILLLLSADDPAETDATRARPVPGKLFLVGDPKQSIYRFRRADVVVYETIKRRLVAQGAKVVHLSTSFRSVPAIQRVVNAAFAEVMKGAEDGSQAEYVPLQPFREDTAQPAVVALAIPRVYGEKIPKIFKWVAEPGCADAVGAFVEWLVGKSGWTVTERDDPEKRVPLQARHVCLLFKRFQGFGEDVTRPYVRALEARRIPHVLLGGRSFHAREEVIALRNALAAIEWPDDELAVYATLRGPLVALPDDALFAYRTRLGSLHPMRRPDEAALDDETRPVAEVLALLARLHAGRNRIPIADTLARLLGALRAHAGIAFWPTGEQALANVLRVLDLARRFEAAGATSFRAFVHRLEREAEEGGAPEAPVVEEGAEGVRLMTVHRAKGLEFPVVILCDPFAPEVPSRPLRWVDAEKKLWLSPLCGCAPIELLEHGEIASRHDRAEATRLLYVAATRARELLVVPIVGDEPLDGWVAGLHPVLYPETSKRRHPGEAPRCPPLGEDTVLDRPAEAWERVVPLRPGLHRGRVGGEPVVVFGPEPLELGKEEAAGVRQQRVLAADKGAIASSEGERMHAAWQAARAETLARGAAPSLVVRSVTEAAKGEDAEKLPAAGIPVASTDAPRAGRPRGKRFGILVHAVLSTVPLDAKTADVVSCAFTQARIVGASDEEIEAARVAVEAALAHPVMQRARAASAVRRETPLLVTEADGSIVEGVVDLAFREEQGERVRWIVVDFKTDAELGEREAAYARQVALYARAIAAATGEPAEGLLLRV